MIYGDHYGISENHNNAMEKLLGEKITPAKFTDLNRTGFWLKVPGKSGGVNKVCWANGCYAYITTSCWYR